MNKLYYTDSKIKEWNTKIVNTFERDGKIYVELEETAFYPEGGGQPSDFGTINDIRVLHSIEEDDKVYHLVEENPEGIDAHCILDYERRLDHSQHHSGQHLLSAVLADLYKANTVGFHLGEDNATIDVDTTNLTKENLKNVENKVNEYIFENIELKTYVVDMEQLKELPVRKMPKADKDIRIVEICNNVDLNACCGTHISKTGEIGLLKILKTEKVKDKTRIYFKCGVRILKDYDNISELLNNITGVIGAGRDDMLGKIKKNEDEMRALQKEVNNLQEKLSKYESKELLDSIKESESNIIEKCFIDKSFKEVQELSKSLVSEGDYIVLLSTEVDNKLLLSHNGNLDVHCGKIFKENLSSFNGRGGGSNKQAQAGFSNTEDLKKFHEFLITQI